MSIEQRIEEVATPENAERYTQARDQFDFCMKLLGLTAYGYKTEDAVAGLMAEFDHLNAQTEAKRWAERNNEYKAAH